VAVGRLDDELVEVAVADDDVSEAAAIEVAALPSEGQERRVDEQLLEEVRARGRRPGQPVALRGVDLLAAAERDVADVRAESEDRVAEFGVHGS
jgi:hypothetical protein